MGSLLSPYGPPFSVKSIAVIGAGPSGLAAAKYLLAEKTFSKITVFEQQSEVGGVWNYTPNIAAPTTVPQTNPHCTPEAPIWQPGASAPMFSNAMYDHLNTNIPKSLMQYSDQDFLPESLLFPSREDVQNYLVKYSQELRHFIAFSTQVSEIKASNGKWKLMSKSMITGEEKTEEYDGILVASGHYSVPFIPSVKNIAAFHKVHPEIISHSKVYRASGSFTGKKVIVVGSAASGLDIGNQISTVCIAPLLNSVHTFSSPSPSNEKKEEVPAIAEYLIESRGVRFEDGRVETDIDAIVYCTGYLYSYPFLEELKPAVVDTGKRVVGLYRDIFSISHPTLAFTALAKKVIPFPLSEAQSAAIAAVWSNRLPLPPQFEMEESERKKIDENGKGTNFHALGYPRDAKYINALREWVMSASGGAGKEPPFWNEKQMWMREKCPEMRRSFSYTGETARTLRELGYAFEEQGRNK